MTGEQRTRFGFPPVPDNPIYPAEPPLSTPIAELAAFWLVPTCACKRGTVYLPCRWLAAHHGWDAPLSAILERLTCDTCKEPPRSVTMVDRPDRMGGGHGGGTEAWAMVLMGLVQEVRAEAYERE